jgi:hypothetical protein
MKSCSRADSASWESAALAVGTRPVTAYRLGRMVRAGRSKRAPFSGSHRRGGSFLSIGGSRELSRTAVLNITFRWSCQKEGGRFELPIALGILVASGQLDAEPLKDLEFLGELSLSGELRPVRGALPGALKARKAHRALLLPMENADEAALVSGVEIVASRHLLDVCAHLTGRSGPAPAGARHGSIGSLGPCLSPDPESRPHHRGPGCDGIGGQLARGGSRRVPRARPPTSFIEAGTPRLARGPSLHSETFHQILRNQIDKELP